MKIKCPSCLYSWQVDSKLIHPGSAGIKCPECGEVFPVMPENQTQFRFGNGRGEIMSWVGEGRISSDNLQRALRLAGMLPGPAQWRRFLEALALWMGVIFLSASVIFFFAYNWQELGHYARFGIVELLLVLAVLAAWRLGLERMSGKASLLAATLMVGALLALVGQTYQTGADPWELFALWAILILPWVLVSSFAPLWLVLLALLNLSAGLYYHAFSGLFGLVFGTTTLSWMFTAINTASLALWEMAAIRGIPWMAERWPARIIATAAAGFITMLAAGGIVDHDTSGILECLGYCIWLACAYLVYRRRVRDLYLLALGVFSLVIVVAVFFGKTIGHNDDAGAFLLIGVVVLGLSAIGGWWLRAVAREGDA